ncbi:MAG: hypothetical protein ABI776_13065 [Nocardioidaceae bacterium]
MSERPTDPRPLPHLDASPVGTGHPTVDAVLASLDGLDGLPPAAHVAVFESAHDRLSDALAQPTSA